MKRLVFLFLIGLLLFSSCVEESQRERVFADGSIHFTVSSYSVETRGTPISGTVYPTGVPFGVFAYYTGNGASNNWANQATTATPNLLNNEKVTNSSGTWGTTGKIYWPQSDDANVTFFAYSPYQTSTNGIAITNTTGVPTLTYTVPITCADQPDLMVATPQQDLNKSHTGAVPIPMKHALTCVGFKVGGNGESITKIAVKGVSVKGTLSLDGSTIKWTGLEAATAAEYTSGINSSLIAGNTMADAMAADGYLMMIPQTLGTDAKIVVTVDGENKEVSLSGQTWTAGQRIMYNLTVGGSEEVEIGGLKWATGNLVADGANDCKIGKPTDGGLYFQFGSLVGWAGGENGNGTGRPASNSPGYTFNSSGIVVPTGKTVPSTWGDPDRWTGDTAEATVPAANDPCRQYLGSPWRLPTKAEVQSLRNVDSWSYPGDWNNGSTSSFLKHNSPNLQFPALGYRDHNNGALNYVGSYGYYWSATVYSESNGYGLLFSSSNVSLSVSNRSDGFPVRCIRPLDTNICTITFSSNEGGTAPAAQVVEKDRAMTLPGNTGMVAPSNKLFLGWATTSGATSAEYAAGASYTPTGDVTLYAVWITNSVTIDNLNWAVGNLVADGAHDCKIGAPTDGGLYFQFGSLVGWAGGASGDGTGRPTSNSPGYIFNSSGIVVPTDKTVPSTWEDPDRWTGGTSSSDKVPFANDPCRYYLGETWRLPTKDEFEALFGVYDRYSEIDWDDVENWKPSGIFDLGSTTSYAKRTASPNLQFPASGLCHYRSWALKHVGLVGYCWSATVYNASSGYYLYFYSGYMHPSIDTNRSYGYPVRCVHD